MIKVNPHKQDAISTWVNGPEHYKIQRYKIRRGCKGSSNYRSLSLIDVKVNPFNPTSNGIRFKL